MTPEQAMRKIVGDQIKQWLIGKGITVAMFIAAIYLVPDHSVMSKEEISEGVVLSKKELALRKVFVLSAALAIKGAIKSTIDLSMLIKAKQKPNLLQAASLVASAPSFLVTYKTIKHRLNTGSGTLNFRELGISNNETRTAGALSLGGTVAKGWGVTKAIMDALDKMPKPQV